MMMTFVVSTFECLVGKNVNVDKNRQTCGYKFSWNVYHNLIAYYDGKIGASGLIMKNC